LHASQQAYLPSPTLLVRSLWRSWGSCWPGSCLSVPVPLVPAAGGLLQVHCLRCSCYIATIFMHTDATLINCRGSTALNRGSQQ
jgi:hypothetical protein